MPQTAMRSIPSARSHLARSGSPWKAEFTLFTTRRSGSPERVSWKSLPRWPGVNGESGSEESCRTYTIGCPAARQASISLPMFASHAGLFRAPQTGWSKPCWTSTTMSATRSTSASLRLRARDEAAHVGGGRRVCLAEGVLDGAHVLLRPAREVVVDGPKELERRRQADVGDGRHVAAD